MLINNYIDHTLLKPLADESLYLKLVSEAKENNFYAICVPPTWVNYCKAQCENSSVKIATVVGFPLGYTETENKASECISLIKQGADEIDFVVNLSWVKSKKFDLIKREFDVLRNSTAKSVIKVILETGALQKEETEKLCELALASEFDFVKTSTGFYEVGARLEDVKIMQSVLGGRVKIKASGGIKTFDQAKAFIDLGVSRIGCSESVNILKQSQSSI